MRNKVLIIDDEADVVKYLTMVLKANGYLPYSLSSALSAMDEVKKIRPDLICLDIMMPGETGISFYAKLRRNKKFGKIPVIIVSGVVQAGNFDIHSYFDDESIPAPEHYLEKPVPVDELIKVVTRYISGASHPDGRRKGHA